MDGIYSQNILATAQGEWQFKHAPRKLTEFVYPSTYARSQFKMYVQTNTLPHLLLHGAPGTGKSTLAHMLPTLLKLADFNVVVKNGGTHSQIADVRELDNELSTMGCFWNAGNFDKKIVIWDEIDCMNAQALKALKGFIDKWQHSASFIVTTNHLNILIDADKALVDRFNVFDFSNPSKAEMVARAKTVLRKESKILPIADIKCLVESCYPSTRSLMKNLQAAVTFAKAA